MPSCLPKVAQSRGEGYLRSRINQNVFDTLDWRLFVLVIGTIWIFEGSKHFGNKGYKLVFVFYLFLKERFNSTFFGSG